MSQSRAQETPVVGVYALWQIVPRPYNLCIPFGLAFVGVPVTAWNAALLAVVML
jgi:hypothetical protein